MTIRRTFLLLVCLTAAAPALVRAQAASADDAFFNANGVKIRYVEAGRGDAVVLIHGFASSVDGNWRQNGVFDALAKDFHAVIPVTAEMTDQARTIMDDYPTLMARDALHAAACRVAGADAICSYDADLDVIAWLRRIEPGEAE